MQGIGPELPLSRSDKFGNYTLITSYREEVKQNFKNLLLTCPGERMMNPDFGIGVRQFLFEPKTDTETRLRQRISRQVNKYMPFVKIRKVSFRTAMDALGMSSDSNALSVMIEYEVPSVNLEATIVLDSEDIN